VGGGAGLVVATAGEREEKDRSEEAHASVFYCRIGVWVDFWVELIWGGKGVNLLRVLGKYGC
jgi:hypothetical protein